MKRVWILSPCVALLLAAAGAGCSKEQSRPADRTRIDVSGTLAAFAAAEEGYRLEMGTYLGTGPEGEWSPAGAAIVADGGASDLPGPWKMLGLRLTPDRKLCGHTTDQVDESHEQVTMSCGLLPASCRFAVVAGSAGSTTGMGSIGLGLFGSAAPDRDWFYVLGRCDGDGDPAVDELSSLRFDQTTVRVENRGR